MTWWPGRTQNLPVSFSNQIPVFLSPVDNQRICSAYFLPQVKLRMTVRSLSLTRAPLALLKMHGCFLVRCGLQPHTVLDGGSVLEECTHLPRDWPTSPLRPDFSSLTLSAFLAAAWMFCHPYCFFCPLQPKTSVLAVCWDLCARAGNGPISFSLFCVGEIWV